MLAMVTVTCRTVEGRLYWIFCICGEKLYLAVLGRLIAIFKIP